MIKRIFKPTYAKGSRQPNFLSFEDRGGMPHAVNNIINTFENLEKAIQKSVVKYQKKVRKNAAAQWGDVASTIMVEFNPSTMSIEIYSDHPDANLLENGTPDTPPKPVIRVAALRAQDELVPMIKEHFKSMGFDSA